MKNFLYLLLLLSFTANLSSQDLTTKDKPKTSKKERVYSAKYQYGIYAPDVIGKDFFKLFSTGKEKKKIFR